MLTAGGFYFRRLKENIKGLGSRFQRKSIDVGEC